MPAYRPPQQILFSPVTNFYQGKAIRQQLAAGEQESELKDLQIDLTKQEIANAPSKRAQAKELALLNIEETKLSIAEKVRTGKLADIRFAADLIAPILLTYNEESGENDENEDQAIGNFNVRIQDAIKRLPESSQEDFRKAAGPDHVFDHNEAFKIGLMIRSFSDLMDETAKTHINYQMPDGSVVAARPDSQEADELVAGGGVVAGSQSLSGGGIKSADQSFILRMTTQHFGGIFDEATQLPKFLDASKQRKASQVTTLATNLLEEGVATNGADAVKRALKAYGEKWLDPGEEDDFDIEAAAKELGVTVKEIERAAQVHNMTPEQVFEQMRR